MSLSTSHGSSLMAWELAQVELNEAKVLLLSHPCLTQHPVSFLSLFFAAALLSQKSLPVQEMETKVKQNFSRSPHPV